MESFNLIPPTCPECGGHVYPREVTTNGSEDRVFAAMCATRDCSWEGVEAHIPFTLDD